MRKVSPVTTEVRYGIMSDFIGMVEDITVAGRLRSAISGKGAFRRFREAVDEDDGLRRRWLAYRTKRHYLLALDWLHRLGSIPEQYGLSPADYDWQPPSEETETPAPAMPKSEAEATSEPAVETQAATDGEAADETQAHESAEEATEPQPAG